MAHTILIAAYEMLSAGEDYADLGEDYFDSFVSRRAVNTLVRRLERTGYEVTPAVA